MSTTKEYEQEVGYSETFEHEVKSSIGYYGYGDIVEITRTHGEIDRDGTYLMEVSGVPGLRHVQALPGGRMRVYKSRPQKHAQNTYKEFECDMDDDTVRIIGRVSGTIKKA